MSANKPDIKLIQKYLNGELNAKAMHDLEREAQDDPFLMDALDGYQQTARNQQDNFEDVKQRFARRTQTTNKPPVFLWRVLPIAASLILVLGIGLRLFLSKPNKQEKQQIKLTGNVLPENKNLDVTVSQPQQSTKPLVAQLNTDTTRALQKKSRLARANIRSNNPLTLEKNRISNKNANSVAEALANMGQSLDITPVNPDGHKTITGIITDSTGHALTGVKIKTKRTQLNAVTDTNGRFTITLPSVNDTLNINYAGYQTKQIPLAGFDGLKVVLNESATLLPTIAVTGHPEEKPLLSTAQPLLGWKAFRAYIKQNAFMPNGQTGKVKLAFTVGADGGIKGIRVVRGKSDDMNQKAIALLLNGPEWAGNTDMKEIKLKIRFRRLKNS